ncbi:exonuclease domain-containing protein [Phthorimaea operculella]|nr:exonuclease domain-containing protein [Phthorimaea operculella]
MTESSKKRKRTSNDKPNQQTMVNRSAIDANWQKLLSSTLLMEKKTEKPAQEVKPNQFTGAFRRTRKKNKQNHEASNSVQNNMKTLNLNTETTKLVSNNTPLANINVKTPNGQNHNQSPKNKLTKFIAIDCEMVGIGYNGDDHMLARVSLVNKFGDCIYDKFVKPREEVIDYRTNISGVRKEDLINAEEFTTVQKEVAEIIRGRILVGHSLKNDLSVLFLSHPKRNIRDTSRYKPFRKITKGSTPSLKRLAKEILGIDIQGAEHSSVEDARAAMQLYCTVAKKWEAMMNEKRGGGGRTRDE